MTYKILNSGIPHLKEILDRMNWCYYTTDEDGDKWVSVILEDKMEQKIFEFIFSKAYYTDVTERW